LAAIDQGVTGPINLGWGRATSFRDLAKMIVHEAKYAPKFTYLKKKPVGVQYRVADNSKLLSFFQPKISLEEGIKRALYG
jgi:nucleoside-diphosphate-sugar epimerase